MSSLIDAHFHSDGPIPKDYTGCGIGLPITNNGTCFGTHGVHPWAITPKTTFTPPKDTCIIGEIGLDYQKQFKNTESAQKAYLKSALSYAHQFNCPVVLHCVRAYDDLYAALKRHPDIRYYLHGFTGSIERATQFQRAFPNLWFGWSPHGLRSNKTKLCFQKLSLTEVLVETDAQPNDRLLADLYFSLAKLHNKETPEIVEQVTVNFRCWLGPVAHPPIS